MVASNVESQTSQNRRSLWFTNVHFGHVRPASDAEINLASRDETDLTGLALALTNEPPDGLRARHMAHVVAYRPFSKVHREHAHFFRLLPAKDDLLTTLELINHVFKPKSGASKASPKADEWPRAR